MTFSGDIWVLSKIADLTSRCGVSPSIANVNLQLNLPENSDQYYYTLSMIDGNPMTDEEHGKAEKVKALLGLDKEPFREFPDLRAVEEAVDHALSLAPRARAR